MVDVLSSSTCLQDVEFEDGIEAGFAVANLGPVEEQLVESLKVFQRSGEQLVDVHHLKSVKEN